MVDPRIITPRVGKYYSVNESNFGRWNRGMQTAVRALNLGLLAALKALLLTYVLTTITDTSTLVLSLNIVFLLLYLASMLLTYSALRRPAKAI